MPPTLSTLKFRSGILGKARLIAPSRARTSEETSGKLKEPARVAV